MTSVRIPIFFAFISLLAVAVVAQFSPANNQNSYQAFFNALPYDARQRFLMILQNPQSTKTVIQQQQDQWAQNSTQDVQVRTVLGPT